MGTLENKDCQLLSVEDFDKLRCSICKGYLNCPPLMVFLGRNDYSECGRCYKAETAEEKNLNPVRNWSLEVLTSLTPFPCKYYVNGCSERRIWPQIEVHEADCLFKIYTCPLNKPVPCKYVGIVKDIENHFKKDHSDHFLDDGILCNTFDKDFEIQYCVKQVSRLFILHVRNDLSKNRISFIVNILEEKDCAEFSIEFSSETSQNTFLIKHNTVCKSNSFEAEDAAHVDLKALTTLLNFPKTVKCKVFLHTKFFRNYATDLLKEIQCPTCWDYLKQKIYMCENGHNVCGRCKPFLEKCPVCLDGAILNVRNLALERVIACSLFPCNNHIAGCTYVATLDEVLYHTDMCSFAELEKGKSKVQIG